MQIVIACGYLTSQDKVLKKFGLDVDDDTNHIPIRDTMKLKETQSAKIEALKTRTLTVCCCLYAVVLVESSRCCKAHHPMARASPVPYSSWHSVRQHGSSGRTKHVLRSSGNGMAIDTRTMLCDSPKLGFLCRRKQFPKNKNCEGNTTWKVCSLSSVSALAHVGFSAELNRLWSGNVNNLEACAAPSRFALGATGPGM